VFRECGQTALQCVQSTSCRTVFQCVATTCLSGGLNPQCLFKCAGSDPSGALAALSVFTCVTGSCGSDCTAVLGALGGLGGGGGFGGGGGKREQREFEQLFSPWPELLTPVDQETR
jgi:hypothetical protein